MILYKRSSPKEPKYIDLGSRFTTLMKKSSTDQFESVAKKKFAGMDSVKPQCYGFVFSEKEAEYIPLFEGDENLILNSDNTVFMDLTYNPGGH